MAQGLGFKVFPDPAKDLNKTRKRPTILLVYGLKMVICSRVWVYRRKVVWWFTVLRCWIWASVLHRAVPALNLDELLTLSQVPNIRALIIFNNNNNNNN